MKSIFELDVEYADVISSDAVTPEQELLIYVVDRAVLDAQNIVEIKDKKHMSAPKHYAWEARGWIFHGDDERIPMSLAWICEHIGCDSIQLMNKIREHTLEALVSGERTRGSKIGRFNQCGKHDRKKDGK